MKCFGKTARIMLTVMLMLFCLCGSVYAGYEFDDLMGAGYTAQWMVINEDDQSFGGKYNVPMNVSSDIVGLADEAAINVINGYSDEDVTNRVPRILFLLLAEGYGEFKMNFKAEDLDFDVSTPNLAMSTLVNDNNMIYVDTKEALGSPEDLGSEWQQYNFAIGRNGNLSTYDTTVQSFVFRQNPENNAAQAIRVPFLISNVSKGSAKDEPLIVRNTLRDSSSSSGNIVAYDRSSWNVTGDKSVGGTQSQWVFVPDTTLITDNDNRYFYLTTEVANHTSIRYKQDETFGAYATVPDYWKFDFPLRQGITYIPEKIYLADTSHIAPGLVSVFKRRYDVNEQNKTPLRLSAVNDTYSGGPYNFVLNHKLISGVTYGKVEQKAPNGNFNLFEITAFKPGSVSTSFYDNVKKITKAQSDVETPSSLSFNSSSVTRDESIAGIKSLTQFFTVEQNISNSSTTEKILPLHITFNIPITLIDDSEWLNDLIQQWYDTGDIEDMFSKKYEISLLTQTDGTDNPWNLTQQLQSYGVDHSQLKVFYDEERGKATQDNSKGLLTVSFIAILMDGTRDGARPELSVVKDYAISQENNYIIIRDGNKDNKLKMTFFVAPAGFNDNVKTNSSSADGENVSSNLSESGSSGTCNAGLYGSAALFVLFFALRRERR